VIKCGRLGGNHIIRLEVQGILDHRDVALRTVSAACRLPFRTSGDDGSDAGRGPTPGKVDLANGARQAEAENRYQEFRSHVVSAVGEAFNNIALHGYKGRDPGVIEIEVDVSAEQLSIELRDYGSSYDPSFAQAPDLEALPESGLGVFIMKSFMDRVEYTPGEPNVHPQRANVLKLTKLVAKPSGNL
jgi:serine/threonine-protein kinase RsbW